MRGPSYGTEMWVSLPNTGLIFWAVTDKFCQPSFLSTRGGKGFDLEGKAYRGTAYRVILSAQFTELPLTVPRPFSLSLWPKAVQSTTLDSGRNWGVLSTLIFLESSCMGWKMCLNPPNMHIGTHTHLHTYSCSRWLKGEQGMDGRRKWAGR